MSAAGTPSTDPWIILARERARYEDQFKSLKPNNGIITGEQAKGYLLQSQLPPAILGQIWTLADTDRDGKMNINEFSIACKLINLKLRGFEIPKGLPPSLLASLTCYSTTATPPAIPPLPNPALLNNAAISRPEPPKIVPMTTLPPKAAFGPSAPLPTHSMLNNMQNVPSSTIYPSLGNVSSSTGNIQPSVNLMGVSTAPIIPTGVVPPMQTTASVQSLVGFGAPQSINTNLPPLGTAINTASLISSGPISPVGSSTGIPTAIIGGSSVINTPRASVTSLERAASIDTTGGVEWSVPHQTKLKYTQIFNTMDRTRTGFLSGAQARNVMVQTKLPQATLAQIWGLSDMDSDGRLGCEEFVLAMHLCEAALAGTQPPSKLAPDLVPPSFRRTTRTASISSQGSAVQLEQDPASTLLQNKRKENYEKGQAELERRRKTLLDQQRKEAEERERKEREELERREKARQEAERKRLEELEKMMRDQQEKERLVEEERKRQAEQREAARKEMERQRQLEWEKQRLQELQQQRQREQETVLKLKAKNQSLTIELTSLNDQVKELSQKICDTRIGVSNVKSTIDGMRSTRDTQMQEMSQLKSKLKDQNAKLLALSQEKVKLDARNKINTQDSDQTKLSFENRDITIKNLRQKIEDIQLQIDSKLTDIENNNSLLTDLKDQMKNLIEECETLYTSYEDKRAQVLEMKNTNKSSVANNYGDAWKGTTTTNDVWGTDDGTATSEWPVESAWNDDNDQNSVPADLDNIPGVHKYRAIYEFSARNNDEISFQPGDIVHVPEQQTGEPGWLAGEIRGKTGWFPESYVEPVDGVGIIGNSVAEEVVAEPVVIEPTKLTEIAEISETAAVTLPSSMTPQFEEQQEPEPEYYLASFAYQSQEPGDLTFNAGDVIAVCKKDGDWWTGKLKGLIGIFPCNYVQKVDNSSNNTTQSSSTTAIISGVSPAAVSSALENISNVNVVNNSQIDNEVSQINEKSAEKPFDTSMLANAQIVKGKKPEIASVIAPYQATSPEQLSLARGQLIMIRKKTDSGWWEGELQAKGRKRQVGWFPASYVKILNSSGKISGRSTPVSTTRMQQEVVIDKVIAMYSYTANNPDELSFLKDDIINVTAREEEAWWRGELNGVSGLFPSNYVGPLQQTQWVENKRRQGAINELIQSEKVYVQDMALIYEVFELPLRKSNFLSTKQVDEIFINYQDILECNKKFLEHLTRSLDRKSNTIGDVICEHLPKMISYRTFCRKQLHSAAFLQELINSHKNLKDLLKKCQNHYLTKGMPLSSFLIKPMQRITKYPLLIKKILENTPHNHPDYTFLEEAARKSESFVSQVNEDIRMKENLEGMEWIQECVQNELNLIFNSSTNKLGQRKLIHYSNFTKLKTGKELIGFLFNDFLMLVQPSKNIAGQFMFQRNQNISYKMYKMPILIQNLQVSRESSDSVENGTDSNRVLRIQDEKSGYKILLLAFTVHECRTWMKEIENCKEIYKEFTRWNIQNKRKTQMHLGPSCGRLLVLVQKGKRFILNVLNTNKYVWVNIVEAIEILPKFNPQICNSSFNRKKGKLHMENIYCKVTLGNQEQETDFAKDNLNNGNFQPANNGALPQIPTLIWNYSMQFQLRNLNEENLTFTIFQHNPFSLDEFLGKAELKIQDIYLETQNVNGPIVKKLILHQVESGEITVKLDLHMFSNY